LPPLISCIVPVKDGERYLGEALDSILAQTYRPLEVIVVVDGESTDRSEDIAREYGDPVAVIRGAHTGPIGGRKRGFADRQGELVAFLDADDVWLPEKLTTQERHLHGHPEVDIVLSRIEVFETSSDPGEAERSYGAHAAYPWSTGLFKSTVLDCVPLDSSLFVVDALEWFLRARETGVRSEWLPQVLARRRLHDTNMTRGDDYRARFAEQLVDVVKDSLDRRRSQS
jgi:glycosyltransferase involved in cell wall biosynthesis